MTLYVYICSHGRLHICIFSYRTVLVHSERIIYIYALVYVCFPFVLDTLRIYSGPFSESTCWWYKFFRNFISGGVQFGFNSTIMFRVNNLKNAVISWHLVYAVFLYRSKIILDCPNYFGRVQIVLVMSKLFWSGPNSSGQVHFRFSGLIFMIKIGSK